MIMDLIFLGAFLSMAAVTGAVYQLICPAKSVSDELGAVAWGFAGGIAGLLMVSLYFNYFVN